MSYLTQPFSYPFPYPIVEITTRPLPTGRFLRRYGHFLPDSEFPLLKMKEPTVICGKYFFANSRVQLPEGKRCMTCHKAINHATVISCHDPNRSKDKGQRQILSIFRGYFQG